MNKSPFSVKDNVRRFENDVRERGSYAYTTQKLSCRYSNAEMSRAIYSSYEFAGKRVLDLGCGDGTYTMDFAEWGAASVLGVDPATAAVESAKVKSKLLGREGVVRFRVGNIYDFEDIAREAGNFDCIILRGVLHHLPDPEVAIAGLSKFPCAVIILEPNGSNPVLKILERFSKYHIEHEERSFTVRTISKWLNTAGFTIKSARPINLVPFFCPDWMARPLYFLGPIVERMPIIRNFVCGRLVFVAQKL